MGLIRFIQAHNRNKELQRTRQIEEQKLDVMENREMNDIRNRNYYDNQMLKEEPKSGIYGEIIRKYPYSRFTEFSQKVINKIEGDVEQPEPIIINEKYKEYELFNLAQEYQYVLFDKEGSLEIYREIIRKYPESSQAELSQKEIDEIEGKDDRATPNKKEKLKEYDEAIDILRKRFAKGEITEKEYEKMVNKLDEWGIINR